MRGTPQRKPTNKHKSAKTFRNNVRKTHPKNVVMQPRRGGWRL